MRKLIVCAICSLLAVTLLHGQTTEPALRAQFRNPAKQYRPIVRWWWPGNDVTEAELRREMGILDAAGFGGAEIQPFAIGLAQLKLSPEEMKRVNDFPSENFFRNMAATADEAKKRGMFVDYTFGSAWPFGGGSAITPELASVELRSSVRTVQGSAHFHGKLEMPVIEDADPVRGPKLLQGLPAGWKERFEKHTTTVAVLAIRGDSTQYFDRQAPTREQFVLHPGQLDPASVVNLTARTAADGTLDWDVPAGTWQIFVFRSIPTMRKIRQPAGEGPQFELDHLKAASFDAHAQRIGDAAMPYMNPYAGTSFRAIFCDSLEVVEDLWWTDDFAEQFKQRRGYDLLPYLPLLRRGQRAQFVDHPDQPKFDMPNIGDQVRHDYWQTVSDLISERMYGRFDAWAHKNGLLTRTQSYGSPGDVLKISAHADIAETENLWNYGRFDFLKLASSASHISGHPITSSESFVWMSRLYMQTPELVKTTADANLSAGINEMVYHGFPYILPSAKDLAGWYPFVGNSAGGSSFSYSSLFNERDPLWPYYTDLNAYITRLQFISQTGKNIADVAIFRHELTAISYDPPAPTPALNQAVMDAGYAYDYVNGDTLAHSTVRNKTLITQGGATYRILFFPATRIASADTLKRLQKFAAEGLPIVLVGDKPTDSDTLFQREKNQQRIHAALNAMSAMQNVYSAADIDAAIGELNRTTPAAIAFHSAPLPFLEKQIGNTTFFFVRNPSDQAAALHATFRAQGRPELWNAWTGEATTLSANKNNVLQLTLKPNGSTLIAFTHDDAKLSTEPAALHQLRSISIGDKGWRLALHSYPFKNFQAADRDLTTLIDWSTDPELKSLSGSGTYTTHFTLTSDDLTHPLTLDLGTVHDAATIRINNGPAARTLVTPHMLDLTPLIQNGTLHAGDNTLMITVSNTLFNAEYFQTPRSFAAGRPATSSSGLMPSGLLGPVQIRVMQ